ncbi:hypothetical protein BL253_24880 [Pseudofrankia asymbiotica]|uniref:Uncharacterized protein n=1 Tax=Pseudofrankia asymbiotica TaxID=1834516 RepID=A0A1V2I7P8_9ACTN|nr:hypothetical protein BL253_24880 [Pseudofrankia asymbiotica]
MVDLSGPSSKASTGTQPAAKAAQSALGQADGTSMISRVGLEGFRAAACAVSGTVTSRNLTNALYGLKDFDVGGLSPQVSFEEGKPSTGGACYWVNGYAGDKFVLPQGPDMKCLIS